MDAFSALSSIGGHWPFSYCHNLGKSAAGAFQILKTTFYPYFRRGGFGTSTAGACLITAANQHQYCEKFGWIIQTRFHFGSRLSQYVGVSVLVNNGGLAALARASGILLLVGVGSYVAYRLCLKLFGCKNLTSLLQCVCNGRPEKQSLGDQRAERRSRCGRRAFCDTKKESLENDPVLCNFCGRPEGSRRFQEDNDAHESSCHSSDSRSAGDNGDLENLTDETDVASDASGDHLKNEDSRINDGFCSRRIAEKNGKRWRNAARKKTNALDDGTLESDDGSSDAGFSKSRSPPPIRRFHVQAPMSHSVPTGSMFLSTPSSKPPSVRSLGMRSVPSSQQFIWDPVCSPGDDGDRLNDEVLAYFADVPTGELVQRFLDGIFWANDQSRTVSPGPSEAASEFSLAADRQLGDGTEANFEQLQFDLKDLQSDVYELDAELTTYLQERSECLQSDSRIFYQSVVVDDSDELSAADIEKHSVVASPSSSTNNADDHDASIAKASPCHRLSSKRHRKSQESSNGSSNSENNNKRSPRHSKKQRSEELQRETGDEPPVDQPITSPCNQNMALSSDTGYSSSCNIFLLSAENKLVSPSSVSSVEEAPRTSRDFEAKRPSELAIGSLGERKMRIMVTLDGPTTRDSRDFLSMESSPSSSYKLTPSRSFNRSPSTVSLEWEDEISEEDCKDAPGTHRLYPKGRHRLKALDLMEFFRLYQNVDNLEVVPMIHEFGKKLSRLGYRRVLCNDPICSGNSDPETKGGGGDWDSLISASLIGAVQFRLPIFKCQSFRIVPEAVDASMKRCTAFADCCSAYFGLTTPHETRSYILQCMQKLWRLHESVQQIESRTKMQRDAASASSWSIINKSMKQLTDGMKILMALRSVETYEEILFTRRTSCAFYTDLFRLYTPSTYAQQKLFRIGLPSLSSASTNVDDLDIALLADTLSVRIEVFRPHSSHPEFVAVYPEMEHNANFNRARLPLLEPGIASGLFLPLL